MSDENTNGFTGEFRDLSSSPDDFIITPKRSSNRSVVSPLSGGGQNFLDQLRIFSGLQLDLIESRSSRVGQGISPLTASAGQSRLLVRMDAQKGDQLSIQSASPDSPVWVERNGRVHHCFDDLSLLYSTVDFDGTAPGKSLTRVEFIVLGEGNKPLSATKLSIYGINLTAIEGITDTHGKCTFSLPHHILNSIPAIVVEPRTMHWNKVLRNASLSPTQTNRIRLTSFKEFDRNIFKAGSTSWGIPKLGAIGGERFTGQGVKIAVIDSGCDSDHDLLRHVVHGLDLTSGAHQESWKVDELGHGTHCSGVLTAKGQIEGQTVRGMAPDAEILVYKVFPGADFFTLGEAVDAAVADGADIISMSLGSKVNSLDVSDSLAHAKSLGVACFAAAGNTADAVQFPANQPSVISVSAIGLISAIPEGTVHSNTVLAKSALADGWFSPAFTCYGNDVDFTAPGVGIISSVPGNGLKALDGTSMACPHIAGLAALILAHDPTFKAMNKDAARVDQVYFQLRRSAVRLNLPTDRIGVGMPTLSEAGTHVV